MRTSNFIQSPYVDMKLLTNDEFQEYKNHSCQEYVRQGKTFNYNKMVLLNKRYLEPKSEEELETLPSHSPEQVSTAGNSTQPATQSDDAAISQQEYNVDMNESNSDNAPTVDIGDNLSSSINTSNIQEAENQNDDSQQASNISMTAPPADPVPVNNVIQGSENVKGQVEKTNVKGQVEKTSMMRPYICIHCKKGYTTKYSRNRHISQMHNNDWKSPQKKDVKRLQNPKKKPAVVKISVPKTSKTNSVFLPVPVPTPVPVQVKYPKPVESMKDLLNRKPPVKNLKKRHRMNLEDSDDETDNLEPPAKSYITSRRGPRRSKNNDDEDGYKSL